RAEPPEPDVHPREPDVLAQHGEAAGPPPGQGGHGPQAGRPRRNHPRAGHHPGGPGRRPAPGPEGLDGRLSLDTLDTLIFSLYILSAALFILGLRGMGSPQKARRGVFLAEVGMLFAVVGTLLRHEIISYPWIALGMFLGSFIGIAISLTIPMTKMPERIAFSHA